MAHFFVDSASGAKVNQKSVEFVRVKTGATVEVGLWGALVNGQTLSVAANNSAVAKVQAPARADGSGMLRHIKVTGLREGNVMLEARLGPGGPVWAFTQIIVANEVPAEAPQAAAATGSGPSDLAILALKIAQEEARKGVFEEQNDNRGERVDLYQNSLRMSGQSWCLLFVYWCFNEAASQLRKKNPLPPIAAVPALLTWAEREKKLVEDPQGGDVLIVKPAKHAGMVAGTPLSTGAIPSVEGNTWANSTYDKRREGVYELKKQKVTNLLFVRP